MNRAVLTLILSFLIYFTAYAQCERVVSQCKKFIKDFSYDGNFYRAQLFQGEYARVKMVLYSGMVYRIIGCSSANNGSDFELYDPAGVRLVKETNANKKYWDIVVGATGRYSVIARQTQGEGCVSLIVGYMPIEDYEKKYNVKLQ